MAAPPPIRMIRTKSSTFLNLFKLTQGNPLWM
ncbi:protein of unknown function (plasmid) [Azospirillum baldaniorum]|uniref:Uncharacterized protein n=1 Tax=Azospirillum baldaniorum TaxID=1064539 RepID=A0A9P1JVQ8_9PROT|nr:protein of unknown function [Azospirillum baldaniorum]